MIARILSNDVRHSRVATLLLLVIVLALALGPFVLPGAKALNIAAKVLIFIVLVSSFDLLLGYTGIVSFAHTMFYGIGAYGVAIAMTRGGAGWGSLAVGIGCALAVSLLLALAIGIFSLRVRAIFYSMITLAIAVAFQTLASQLSEFTGGEDGMTFRLPAQLMPSFRFSEETVLGITLDGKVLCYYLLFAMAAVLFLMQLRIVNSPFGRVLQAVRENEFRTEAIGYRVIVYRTLSSLLSAAFACLAGVMLAMWLRYAGPDAVLSFEIMIDILLIVTIGGIGTLYGAIIGTAAFLVAQGYLQEVLVLVGSRFSGVPWLPQLFSADRWLLWLGLLFVLAVYYVPDGIIGYLNSRGRRGAASHGGMMAVSSDDRRDA